MSADLTELQLAIRANAAALNKARANLDTAVVQARGSGMTWSGIGEALGISRQAAWERFAAQMPPGIFPGRPGPPSRSSTRNARAGGPDTSHYVQAGGGS